MTNSFGALLEYTQRVGSVYGVEDFAVFLYSIVRMQKQEVDVELGTGSAACSLMIGMAMLENGCGKIVSFDNGSHWDHLRKRAEIAGYIADPDESYKHYLALLSRRFLVDKHVEYVEANFPPYPESSAEVELLFVDYESHPAAIATLLAHYLPRMAEAASIFFDGVATYLPSFLFMERIINQLNQGQVPSILIDSNPLFGVQKWIELVHTRRFTLVHINEKKARKQNSTSWLKIEPVGHISYPATLMR